MLKIEDNSPQVRFPPPFVFLGFLLLGLLADRLFGLDYGAPAAVRIIGGIAAAVAIGLVGAALGLFRRAGNNPEPWKETGTLITNGVYRFTRNPMYLAMALLHLGIAMILASPGAVVGLLLAVIVIDRAVIAREEAYLARVFGADYNAYRLKVRRWL